MQVFAADKMIALGAADKGRVIKGLRLLRDCRDFARAPTQLAVSP